MCAQIHTLLRDSVVIPTIRGCACGTVRFSSTPVFRVFHLLLITRSASGGIIRDSIQMGDYSVDTYLVDVL